MKLNTRAGHCAAALLTTSLLLGACGADDTTDAGSTDATPTEAANAGDDAELTLATFPVTVTADNGDVVLEALPTSIISLSSTSTEILFAIGAGEQVIAVDDYSDFPKEAPTTDLSGFQPNIEAILAYEPDLVVVSYDPGDLVAALESAGVPTIIHGAAVTLDDTYRQIEQLGVATGHVGEAAEAVLEIQTELGELVAALPQEAAGLTYYHELDTTFFSATSATFIGELYSLFGLVNIADAADPAGESFGYPQLSAEFIVDANPDFVFLADTRCCEATAATVAERPGWDQISAVRDGSVIELDDDVASRWGPRVVEQLRTVAAAIDALVAARASS